MRAPNRTLLLFSLLPVFLAACGGDEAGTNPHHQRPPATDYLLVENGDGMVLYGEVPIVTIAEHVDGYAVVEVRAEAWDEANTRLWYLFARVDPADLRAGVAERYQVLGSTAEVPREVNVGIEGESVEVARAGTASIRWVDGWIEGQVVNDDPRMAAKFQGGYQVSCSYLVEGRTIRTVDETFESEFCSPFAGILPPEEP